MQTARALEADGPRSFRHGGFCHLDAPLGGFAVVDELAAEPVSANVCLLFGSELHASVQTEDNDIRNYAALPLGAQKFELHGAYPPAVKVTFVA